jgi:hypothetical protein
MYDIKIFQAFHKPYIHNPDAEWICPVAVGTYENPEFSKDNRGENISSLNPYYCELTVLYWAWKNQRADVVGLYHYRRYLSYLPDNAMGNSEHLTRVDETLQNIKYLSSNEQKSTLIEKLKAYDFIIPRRFTQMPSIGILYRQLHRPEPWDAFMSVLRKKYQPSQVDAYFSAGDRTTICNMFVTRWENFDDYCNQLFDVIDQTYKQVGVPFSDWHNRYPGFLAERFLGFWLHVNRMTTAEVPLIHLGE